MPSRKGVVSARSVQYWLSKGYTQDEARTLARSRMPGTVEYYEIFKGFSREDAERLSKEWNESRAITESNFISKYGQAEGVARWNSYREKQAHSNTFEYKKKRYGWTKEKFDEYNKSRSVTLDNLVKRHGTKLGTEKYNAYVEAQRYTNTIDYFIEKYGAEDGKARFERYCKMKSHSYEAYLERFSGDADLASKALADFYAVRTTDLYNSSAVCKKFCAMLHKKISAVGNFSVFYADYTQEYYFGIPGYGRAIVDFYVKELQKVVEFYGDYWHCNPKIYKHDDIIKHPGASGKLVNEVWEHDRRREDAIKSLGVDVMVVWESDFRENPDSIVDVVCNWLFTVNERTYEDC
jgi:very-short-patch-repair endonuclease